MAKGLSILSALTDGWWEFGRGGGGRITPRLRLQADGSIAGHDHPNEAAWRIQGGVLEFLGRDGAVTTRFLETAMDETGCMVLSGPFLPGAPAVQHVLRALHGAAAVYEQLPKISFNNVWNMQSLDALFDAKHELQEATIFAPWAPPPQRPLLNLSQATDEVMAGHARYAEPPPIKVYALHDAQLCGVGLFRQNEKFFFKNDVFPDYFAPYLQRGQKLPDAWAGASERKCSRGWRCGVARGLGI